ncbi:myosin-like protein [Achlya hypogyna]|uniref:Myosin-like protein n=1 Tax=Achlya hypogyna TaxID=1202772 RepID=A0A1V9ZM59_ACHHY|nr:myosin-like protein [Achlya hypogyna]
MSLEMVPGAQCYVPDETDVWLPAEVIGQKPGTKQITCKVWTTDGRTEERVVDLEDKKTRALMSGKGEAMDSVDTLPFQNENVGEDGIEDMITLNYLHEAAILYNVKKRFLRELPYTYTGTICIAVNPYKWLPDLYAEEQHIRYLNIPREELPPHVYATSVASYENMKTHSRNQSILVSGESGAGKTETTKILMNHLATIAGGLNDGTIKKIIQVSPLLEYFGNAKTVRNDNSSRFGKFTQLQFDHVGTLVGAKCKTYLLEKTRVIGHEHPERNYHIFYQLIDSGDVAKKLFLDPSAMYRYIGEKSTALIEGKSDAHHFTVTENRLSLIGFAAEAQLDLYKTLAGILHLGNMQIIADPTDDEKSKIAPGDVSATYITQLMGLTMESLEKALCSRTMRARNDVYSVPLKKDAADGCLDALAKAIYSRIFDWLVELINQSLSNDAKMAHHIGVLDIFGFEHFKFNSFEQFCINYANEKLQQKFTSDVFKTVQIEYEEEGIQWEHIEFSDNQDVLNVIEDRIGIISLLNEELKKTKGSEAGFMSTISSINKDLYKPSVIEFPRTSRTEFIIKHYAAPVKYESLGFLEKHKDMLLPDLSDLMRGSSMEFIQKLFEEKAAEVKEEPVGGRRRGGALNISTVGSQFKDSLTELMNTIQATNVQYVRCIKPNPVKSSTEMDNAMVVSQLRCAGVIEAIRISRAAYPNRQTHEEFLAKFRLFVPSGPGTPREKCEQLMTKLKLSSPEQYQMGWTKIYFQLGVLEELEDRRKKFLDKKARFIQKIMRGFTQRIKYLRQLRAIVKLQSVIRCVLAMHRYNTFLKGLVKAQARIRGIQGRKIALEVKRNHCAVIIQRHLLGYAKRTTYKRKRRLIIRVQAYARMHLERPKYLAALKEKKMEADMQYQLKMLQQRLLEEQARNAELAQAKTQATDKAIISDSADMIGSLQDANAIFKKENDEMKSSLAALKSELEKLKLDKELAMANTIVKLKQEQEALKVAHKKIEALEAENNKLKDVIAKGGFPAHDTAAKPARRKLFRTIGAKKISEETLRAADGGPMLDSITDEKDVGASNSSLGSAVSALKSAANFKRPAFWRNESTAAATHTHDSTTDEKRHSDCNDSSVKTDVESIEREPRTSVLNSAMTGAMTGAVATLKGRIGMPSGFKNLYSKGEEKKDDSVAGTNGKAANGSQRPALTRVESKSRVITSNLPPQESFNLDSLPEAPLPMGWEAKVSRNNGKVYYVNKSLKLTQWDRPTIETLKLLKQKKAQESAPVVVAPTTE